MIRWRNNQLPQTMRYVHSPLRSPRSSRSSCGHYDWPGSRKATISVETFDESLEAEMDENEAFLKLPSRTPRMARRTSSLVLPPTHLLQGSSCSEHSFNRSRSTSLKKRRVTRYSSHDRELDRYYTSGVSLKRRNPLLAKVEKKGTGDSFRLFKKFFSNSIDEDDGDAECCKNAAKGGNDVRLKNHHTTTTALWLETTLNCIIAWINQQCKI